MNESIYQSGEVAPHVGHRNRGSRNIGVYMHALQVAQRVQYCWRYITLIPTLYTSMQMGVPKCVGVI